MKILVTKDCQENIDEFSYIYSRDVFRRRNLYYKFKPECSVCGQSFFMRLAYPTNVCSVACSNKLKSVRDKISLSLFGLKRSPSECAIIAKRMSKGGVVKKNIPLYDTYAKQLIPIEVVRNVSGVLEVRCANCNNWFTPKRTFVESRAQYIKGNIESECRLYCSDICKYSCPIFNKHKHRSNTSSKQNKHFTSTQLSVWSAEVIKRAKFKCEYCGKPAKHAHHERPKRLEPFFALDPDNGVACCVKCHYKHGHIGDCSAVNISKASLC